MTVGTKADMGNWARKFFLQNGTEMKLFTAGNVVALVLLQSLKNQFFSSQSRAKLPPGRPRNLPVLGAMLSAAKKTNMGEWYSELAGEDLEFYFRLLSVQGEGAEEGLKTKDALLAHRPDKTLIKPAAKYIFGGENIITASFNKEQKNLKKLLTANFFSTTKLALSENIRRREGAFLLEGIQRQIDAKGTIKVGDSLLDMNINFICALVFGKRYSDSFTSEGDELKHFPKIIRGASTLTVKNLEYRGLIPMACMGGYWSCERVQVIQQSH